MGHAEALTLIRSAAPYELREATFQHAGETRVVGTHRAIVRSDDGAQTGMGGPDYAIVQSLDVLGAFFRESGPTHADGSPVLDPATSLPVPGPEIPLDQIAAIGDHGERFAAQAFNATIDIEARGGLDRIGQYLLARWAHTGRDSVEYGSCDTRFVCSNTLAHATREAKGSTGAGRFRHTSGVKGRIFAHGSRLARARSEARERAALYQTMARTDITRDQAAGVARAVATGERAAQAWTTEQARENMTAKAIEAADIMVQLFDGRGDGADLAGRTAWGAFNSATQYLDRNWAAKKDERALDRYIRTSTSAEADERRTIALAVSAALVPVTS
jgi:hypothetical protein